MFAVFLEGHATFHVFRGVTCNYTGSSACALISIRSSRDFSQLQATDEQMYAVDTTCKGRIVHCRGG
jgi:hypothetical protein